MRLLYIADGRSPITLNWISYFIQSGYEVHLASTFPCAPIAGLGSLTMIPVAMSEIYPQSEGGSGAKGSLIRRFIPVSLRTQIRQLVAPLTFPRAVKTMQG